MTKGRITASARLAAALVLGATGVVSATSSAHALPGAALDTYRITPSSRDTFSVNRPEVPAHLVFEGRLVLDYANDPLVYEQRRSGSASEKVSLVSDQLVAHLAASLGILDVASLFITLPTNLVMEGESLGMQPTATGFGFGDLGFGARGVFYRGPAGSLGVQLTATAPTGEDGDGTPAVAGDASATFEGIFLGELDFELLRISANAGVRFRDDQTLPVAAFGDLLTYALAVSMPLASDSLRVSAEVFGTTPSDDVGRRATSPLEALLGATWDVDPAWTLGLAGGLGLTRGYGAPDLRVLAALSYRVDLHRLASEPVPEPEPTPAPVVPVAPPAVTTPTPSVAETSNDLDRDGMPDTDDQCPTLYGPPDLGGCPEHFEYAEERGALVATTPIRFTAKQASLVPDQANLEELVRMLVRDRSERLLLSVHVSAGRDPAKDLQLTHARARALATYLVEHDVRPEQLDAYACGSSRPVISRRGQPNRSERVELFLINPLPKQGMPSTLGCEALVAEPPAAPVVTAPVPAAAPVVAAPVPAAAPVVVAPAPPAPAPVAAPVPPAPAVQPAPPQSGPRGVDPVTAAQTRSSLLAYLASNPGKDDDGDGVTNAKDACPLVPARGSGCTDDAVVDLDAGEIVPKRRPKFSGTAIANDRQAGLTAVAQVLAAHPTWKIRVEAHTADAGETAENLKLSKKRADSVRAWLTEHDIPKERLAVVGCGEIHPIAPNNVPWGQKKNERIDFVLLDPAPDSGVRSPEGCESVE